MQYFQAQRKNGGALIVADPRLTPTAAAATLHLQITPGTDAALGNGLLNIAVRERYIDSVFISKAAYLTQAFDRDTPLPGDRLALLFDIGAPAKQVTLEEMPSDMQICNCDGVKGALMACVKGGRRSLKSVMEAARAGMGAAPARAWCRKFSSGRAAASWTKIRRFIIMSQACR